MSNRVLVTGGTGTVGRVVVALLMQRGADVRVLSRKTDGDLVTGRGLTEAMSDVDTVIHCATTNGRNDMVAARNLVAATRQAHLVYISIVGVDRIPLGYYKAKLAAEHLIEESGCPFTILRTTQFHDLLVKLLAAQKGPFLFIPTGFRFQPIDTSVVAARLVELSQGAPQGRVADMGGPEVHTARALAEMYLRTKKSRKRTVGISIPGHTARAFREGHNLASHSRQGPAFREFLDLKLS